MLIPHLHFYGNCNEAIAMYEKAFNTKAKPIIRKSKNMPVDWVEGKILHAAMEILGQTIYLNDRFGNKNMSHDCAIKLSVIFKKADDLIACYEIMKEGSIIIDPLEKVSFSKLMVQFIDRFGVQWGFMVKHG